nr:antibiotic biosynthesis monooxygenase [Sphingomonas insulae]
MLIAGAIRLPVERAAAARPAMRAMVEASRAEAGCMEYSYAEDVIEPGLIHVIERWQDRAALERLSRCLIWRRGVPAGRR